MIFAEYLVARGATRAHWRIRRRRRTWALRVMRADATAVGRPATFCFELCGRSDTSRALPQSSDAPPRPSTNVRASVPARAPGSVRRRPRNHGPITHLPRRAHFCQRCSKSRLLPFSCPAMQAPQVISAYISLVRAKAVALVSRCAAVPVVGLAFSLPPSSS